MPEKKDNTESVAPDAPKQIIGNGKAIYRCTVKCWHHDTLYNVEDKVCPPEGGDLPADYFEKV